MAMVELSHAGRNTLAQGTVAMLSSERFLPSAQTRGTTYSFRYFKRFLRH